MVTATAGYILLLSGNQLGCQRRIELRILRGQHALPGHLRELAPRLLRLALPLPKPAYNPPAAISDVRAALDDRPLSEHEDLVGADDGGEPVRDHQRGAVLRHAVERVLDVLLGVAVERGGRLVEQQDRRRFEDRARDGDALLLAAGKLQAALADLGLVALRRAAG